MMRKVDTVIMGCTIGTTSGFTSRKREITNRHIRISTIIIIPTFRNNTASSFITSNVSKSISRSGSMQESGAFAVLCTSNSTNRTHWGLSYGIVWTERMIRVTTVIQVETEGSVRTREHTFTTNHITGGQLLEMCAIVIDQTTSITSVRLDSTSGVPAGQDSRCVDIAGIAGR